MKLKSEGPRKEIESKEGSLEKGKSFKDWTNVVMIRRKNDNDDVEPATTLYEKESNRSLKYEEDMGVGNNGTFDWNLIQPLY